MTNQTSLGRRVLVTLPISIALACAGLLSDSAQAAPAPLPDQVKVMCPDIGEVSIDITGNPTVAGGAAVHDPGPVSMAGPASFSGATATGAEVVTTGTTSGLACSPVDVSGVALSSVRAGTTTVGGAEDASASTTTVDGRLSFSVAVDYGSVLAAAAPSSVSASIPGDPAGYGPVTSFPYSGQLATYAAGRSGSLALAYRATNSQTIYSFVKSSSTNVTASIVKVDIMATVMYRAQRAGRALTSWEKSQLVPMIRYSDNTAATNLWNYVGQGPGVAAVNSVLGLRNTTMGSAGYWGLTVTTAPDQVVLVDHFARSNPVLSYSMRSYGLSLMRSVSSSQNWGVTAGPGTDNAVKNGWLPRTDGWHVNSIGYMDDYPQAYSIAALTHSTTAGMTTQINTIEGASRIVWSHQKPPSVTVSVYPRGDWTGNGTPDMLGVKGDSLYVFPGYQGNLTSPVLFSGAGPQWSTMSFLGSPGDITGDGRPDLIAESQWGTLFLYPGVAGGKLGARSVIGSGWTRYDKLLVGGDINGDGKPDLLARTPGGSLVLFRLTARTGVPTLVGTISTGWANKVAIVESSDFTGDKVADLIAIDTSGVLQRYRSTKTSIVATGPAWPGWSGWKNSLVAVPGNINRSGADDLVQVDGSGKLWVRPQVVPYSFQSPVAAKASVTGFTKLA